MGLRNDENNQTDREGKASSGSTSRGGSAMPLVGVAVGASHVQHLRTTPMMRKKALRNNTDRAQRASAATAGATSLASTASTAGTTSPGILLAPGAAGSQENSTLRKKGLSNNSRNKRRPQEAETSSYSMPSNEAQTKKGLRNNGNSRNATQTSRDEVRPPPLVPIILEEPSSTNGGDIDIDIEIASRNGSEGLQQQQDRQQWQPSSSIRGFPLEAKLVVENDEEKQRIREELRNEILDEAVIGEAIPVQVITNDKLDDEGEEGQSSSNKRKKLILFAGIVILLSVIGIILWFTLAGRAEDSTSPFGAATLQYFDESTLPPTTLCKGRPFEMGFLFNGGGCEQSNNSQEVLNKFTCLDANGGPPASRGERSYIVVTDLEDDILYFEGWVGVGDPFTLRNGGNNFVSDEQLITIKS